MIPGRNHPRLVRLTLGSVLLASSGVGLLLAPGASAQAAPGSGLGSFSLAAAAPAAQFRVDDGGNCAGSPSGTGACEGVIPEAVSTLSNGPVGFAISSVVWPGALAGNAGTLLLVSGGDQVPPQATMLNSPVRAEARTGDKPTTNSDYPGATMKASAEPYDVRASGEVAQSQALAVGTFGNAVGSSRTAVTGAKDAVAEASSRVSDISLAAGAVKIGAVTSTAKATTDGTKTAVGGSTTTSGMSIGGVPVTVDEKGISVAGQSNPLGQTASGAVNTVISNLNMKIAVSEPTTTSANGSTTYNAGSLVFVWEPQPGTVLSAVFGSSTVTVAAAPSLSFDTGDTPAPPLPVDAVDEPAPFVPDAVVVDAAPVAEPVVDLPVELTPVEEPVAVDAPPAAPVQAVGVAKSFPLFGGIPSLLVIMGLAGVGFLAAGLRRLPDQVLATTPTTTCPLGDVT